MIDIKEKYKQIPIMFYNVDMTNKDSKDMTCVAYLCSHCNTVFHTDYYDDVEPEFTEYQACASCGVKFKGWYQC